MAMKRQINFHPPKVEDPKQAAEVYIRAMYGMTPAEYANYIIKTVSQKKAGDKN